MKKKIIFLTSISLIGITSSVIPIGLTSCHKYNPNIKWNEKNDWTLPWDFTDYPAKQEWFYSISTTNTSFGGVTYLLDYSKTPNNLKQYITTDQNNGGLFFDRDMQLLSWDKFEIGVQAILNNKVISEGWFTVEAQNDRPYNVITGSPNNTGLEFYLTDPTTSTYTIKQGCNQWSAFNRTFYNSIEIPMTVGELYNQSFDIYTNRFNQEISHCDNNQYDNGENPEWPVDGCGDMAEIQFGSFSDTTQAKIQHLYIDGIDNNPLGYKLQLGNPYGNHSDTAHPFETWNKLFYHCYSLRNDLHHYFDGYTVTVADITGGQPTGESGQTTTTHILSSDDVDAMIDGY